MILDYLAIEESDLIRAFITFEDITFIKIVVEKCQNDKLSSKAVFYSSTKWHQYTPECRKAAFVSCGRFSFNFNIGSQSKRKFFEI